MPSAIAVRGLFATPVAAIASSDADARNARHRQLILARRELFPSIHSSNAGGWHSALDLADWGGTDVAAILALAQSAAT